MLFIGLFFLHLILNLSIILQVPVHKEPKFCIPGTAGIVKHEVLNNKRHVLTEV